ncbi:MAG: folate-binding protein YgfZ [Alphaproteobacteria bacterium]|nr:folate-binding protein YgfZ [Alphaproteobacteria bacterium]
MTPSFAPLGDRGVLEVAGADRVAFLQGLVSNDVTKAAAGTPVYAALLTAQGKYLHDFFVVVLGDALYLDGERARLGDLQRRLSLYKLRSKVTLADASARLSVAAAWGSDALAKLSLADGAAKPFAGGIAYIDPRLPALGARFLIPAGREAEIAAAGFARADAASYDRHRLALGVPDGSRDLEIEKSILLENGFEELNGVDFAKGCYMGQELTARTKYRALIKKRLVPVTVEGPLPPIGTPVTCNGEDVGEIRSGTDGLALAMLKLDALGGPLAAGTAKLAPQPPAWMKLG